MALTRSLEELEHLRDIFCTNKYRANFKHFNGCLLPESFEDILDELEHFEIYDDDVWVTSFPKCGTTWVQEMVWCIANKMDLEGAKLSQSVRFPFLEYSFLNKYDEKILEQMPHEVINTLQYCKEMKRPRFIKTHLPWDLLPKQIRNFEKRPKIIHITRNAKDVCISYYHHSKLINGYSGDFDLFTELFRSDQLVATPFFKTILSYWNRRNEPNILLISYENMKKDLTPVIKQVTQFLNATLTYKQMEILLHHLSFNSMKKNKSVNKEDLIKFVKKNKISIGQNGKFMRSGVSGGFKTEMTPQQVEMFDVWIQDKLKKSGFSYLD